MELLPHRFERISLCRLLAYCRSDIPKTNIPKPLPKPPPKSVPKPPPRTAKRPSQGEINELCKDWNDK